MTTSGRLLLHRLGAVCYRTLSSRLGCRARPCPGIQAWAPRLRPLSCSHSLSVGHPANTGICQSKPPSISIRYLLLALIPWTYLSHSRSPCHHLAGLCVPGPNSLSLRSHSCGELRSDHVGERVTLCGWVQYLRWHSSNTLTSAIAVFRKQISVF